MPEPSCAVAVVEDDDELRALLIRDLRHGGFEPSGYATAAAFWRDLAINACDLVVLDIGLPDEDGFSIARHLRQVSTTGIVMLTGRGSSQDQIQGLSDGADAYLVKPVDPRILIATLRSVARRLHRTGISPRLSAEGLWQLDSDGWSLRSPDGETILLTASERSLLTGLVAARGRPVAREELIAHLTDDVHDFDPHRLEMIIYRLRRKIAVNSARALPLKAVRGLGYCLSEFGER